MRDNELTGNAETHNASSGPVKHDCSRGGTLRIRDCGQSRDVLHGRGRPARATDPLKNNQGGHSGVRNQEDHRCGHNNREEMGGRRGMSSGTQRESSAELAGGALKSMGMSRCSAKEAARRGSDRTGTRSCLQKGQRSPQEWTEWARHS